MAQVAQQLLKRLNTVCARYPGLDLGLPSYTVPTCQTELLAAQRVGQARVELERIVDKHSDGQIIHLSEVMIRIQNH